MQAEGKTIALARGAPSPTGSQVRLRLRRPGESGFVDVVVTRRPIERPLVALTTTG